VIDIRHEVYRTLEGYALDLLAVFFEVFPGFKDYPAGFVFNSYFFGPLWALPDMRFFLLLVLSPLGIAIVCLLFIV
jgi:hypothetical protein